MQAAPYDAQIRWVADVSDNNIVEPGSHPLQLRTVNVYDVVLLPQALPNRSAWGRRSAQLETMTVVPGIDNDFRECRAPSFADSLQLGICVRSTHITKCLTIHQDHHTVQRVVDSVEVDSAMLKRCVSVLVMNHDSTGFIPYPKSDRVSSRKKPESIESLFDFTALHCRSSYVGTRTMVSRHSAPRPIALITHCLDLTNGKATQDRHKRLETIKRFANSAENLSPVD